MSDNVLLMNEKSGAAPWKAFDVTAGWQGQGASADQALADVARKSLAAAAGLGAAAPARIPAVYTDMFGLTAAIAVGTIAADEYGTGSPAMVVKLLVV